MSALRKILDETMTVEVMGESISLRHPPYQVTVRIRRLLESANLQDQERRTASVVQDVIGGIITEALSATVIGQDLTEEDWSRLISISNDDPDAYPGLTELCNQALKLCGINMDVGNVSGKVSDDGESETDLTDVADKSIGMDPT